MTETIDLRGILADPQALGSTMGATGVRLVPWSNDRGDWLLPPPDGEGGLPMSVLRYVQRTGDPLIVGDATNDERFAHDPYFTAVEACSLLALPIRSGDTMQAVLLLENRLERDTFTSERLERVKLVAGQLAVSLHNAELYAGARRDAEEQAALRRVATLVAQGTEPAALFDAAAAEIEGLLDADEVVLGRYEPEAPEVTVVAHRRAGALHVPPEPRIFHDATADTIDRLGPKLGMRASSGVPIVVDGRPWGVAIAAWQSDAPPPAGTEERIAQFARLLGTAIANARRRAELAASRARLITEADAARRRVVEDMHDGAQQRLVHTVITLELALRALKRSDGEAETLVAEALGRAQQANAALRELAHRILPADLTRGGLRGAVDAVVERLDLEVEVDLPTDRFPEEIEASAYFVVAEALTNVLKHARAESAAVSASVQAGMLRVEVRDDGIGGADPGGRGLVGMNDRVTALGGQLSVVSPPGAGTVLTATFPTSPGPAGSA
jgi:signal transduction histidine kinase